MAISTGLQSHIWNNNIRSILLLAGYPFIIMGMIWLVAYAVAFSQGGYNMRVSQQGANTVWTNVGNPEYVANSLVVQYWPMILTVIAVWFVVAWFWNTSMVRALSNARKVTRAEEPEIYNLLENLSIAEGMPMPQLNIIETPALNAFASGIDSRSYTVTLTRGLINTLEKDELEAVIGHELAHIINRDVRLLIVTVIFTGMIGFAAQMVWNSLRFGRFHALRGGGRNKGGGIILILAIGAILWIGYMATLFMRFALSRRREYMADAGAVKMTKNPEAMMRALMKISGRDYIRETTEDIRMMCIENAHPFMGLFATHPPIESRIKAISQVTNTPVPSLAPRGDEIIETPSSSTRARRRYNPWARRG